MPTYTVQGPSGRTYTIEGPEGASPEQLGQFILSQNRTERVAMQVAKDRAEYDPTKGMGTGERLLAATGMGMSRVGRALGQLVGAVDQKDIDEAHAIEAPLAKTTAGKVGNVIGQGALALPAAFVPGANTYLGATAIGGALGGLTTEGGLKDRALGALGGALGGAGGKALGDGLAAGARALSNRPPAIPAQRTAAVQNAQQAGYVLPPTEIRSTAAGELLEGLSGKIKTAQVASARNQEVTNKLVRRSLGMADDAQLDTAALEGMRKQVGQVYEQVKSAGRIQPGEAYDAALNKIAAQYQGAAKDFPGAAKNEVQALVDSLRVKEFDASSAVDMVKILREGADKAYRAGDTGLGKANKAAANALEDALERHLDGIGQPELLNAFKSARQTIAKTYTAQKALNPQTGDVSAQVLARELSKGKPLSGEMKTVAEIAQAFPRATQALKEQPKAISPLDYLTGLASVPATGSPAGLLAVGARPAARSLALSGAYQRALAREPGPGLLGRAAPLVESDQLRKALILTGGLLGSPALQQ